MGAPRIVWLAGLSLLLIGCSWEGPTAFSQEATPAPAGAGGSTPPREGQAAPPAQRPANRLARETSPYLLLHAHNPVDWYPWGPEALEAAQREQKPIFLSIGYSSCFWCHVMEREVFENEEIARYMNEHFINIKVDREERPDLDDVYMTAVQVYFQLANSPQGGGWPLSMFLTPQGKPIAGGTYFPPRDLPGRPGFLTVLQRVHEQWTTNRENIERTAELMAGEVRRILRPPPDLPALPLTRRLVDEAVTGCLAHYDPEFGGLDFSSQQPHRPKFPVPSRLSLLQAQAGRPESEQAVEAVDHTLQAMAAGGIYDHLGGGFHRYSTDRQWRVPHFEKMLYDNAQLAAVYAEAFQRTSRRSYRQVAEETIHFVLRELTDPAGGFYSALDAETNGVEGAHYVWSPDEITQRLGAADARLFMAAYGLDQPQFFEHGYVLLLPRSLDETAARLELPATDLESRLAEMRRKLLAVRSARPPLLKDDKVLTSWNGLMIGSLARAGRILNRPDFVQAAEQAAMFVVTRLRDDQGRLFRTWRGGQAKIGAYLDDYAYLVHGLLELHAATGDPKWLNASRRLVDDQTAGFWDEQEHGFFFTSRTHEELLARTKDAYDSVLPSGNSVSVRNLVRLAILTGDDRYRDLARQTLRVFAPVMQRSPASLPYMALALQEYLTAFPEEASSAAPPTAAPSTPTPTPTPSPATAASPPAGGPSPWAVQPPDDSGKHKARVTIYLGQDRLVAGETTPVAVVIDIAEGWHLNANPPRPEFVIPTEVTVTTKHGTELTVPSYPAGRDFRVEGIDEPLSVYEQRVVILGRLRVPLEAAGQTEELTFTLRYQACNDRTCTQPQRVSLSGTVPVSPPGTPVRAINAELFAPASVRPQAP